MCVHIGIVLCCARIVNPYPISPKSTAFARRPIHVLVLNMCVISMAMFHNWSSDLVRLAIMLLVRCVYNMMSTDAHKYTSNI